MCYSVPMINDDPGEEIDLVRSCICRDHSAWDRFVKKYSGLILSSAGYRVRKYGLFPKSEDLNEILQEVLTLLWDGGKLAELKNASSLRYWLSIVSGNAALMYMRRKKRREDLFPVSLSEMSGSVDIAEIIPARGGAFPDEPDRAVLSGKLEEAVEGLPEKERLALKLNLIYEKRHDEIAEIMSIPRATVTSHIRRARKRLQKALKDYR